MENNLRQQQKEVAIKLMETMDLYKPYIRAFKEHDTITMYEQYGGYYLEDGDPILAKIREFDDKI